MTNVVQVQANLVLGQQVVAAVDLGDAGDPRPHAGAVVPSVDALLEGIAEHRPFRTGTDQGHVPLEHVPQLRDLIRAGLAQDPPQSRHPHVTKPTLSQLEAILAYPIASAPGLPGGSNAGVPGVAGNTLNLGQTLRIYDSALDARHIIYDHISSGRSSGGTRSSGGGSGSGSSSTPFRSTPTKNYTVGTNGRWELIDASTHKWAFVLNGGIRLTSTWGKLDYANDDVNKNGWYHFNSRGLMDIGWFKDEKGDWYYCNTERDGWLGKMKMGWHLDETDKSWYYLDAQTGKMATGWTLIDGKWYYFAEYNAGDTYGYDAKEENWYYFNNGKRPLRSMYRGEKTPDGYQVDQNGAWIQ